MNLGSVTKLNECELADTFPASAEQLGVDGFAFLYQRMKAGLDDGPIFVTVEDRRIVGAIGPLSTMIDATGTRQQPPSTSPSAPATEAAATAERSGVRLCAGGVQRCGLQHPASLCW